MRQPHEYIAVHKAADYFEARVRRQFVRQMRALRNKVSVEDLAQAIIRPANRRGRLLPSVSEALAPVADITKQAVAYGGKVGATHIQRLK